MSTLWVSAGLKNCSNNTHEEVRGALETLQSKTVTESGCIRFDVLQNKANPHLFTLWEEWVNEDALTAHFKHKHTLDYLAMELTEVVYIEKLSRINL
ncbi:antibiotic biosynthesis monooxygenase [Alteromonas sp. 5E99-2]|uniref:putative quinol monooxygenase n=1 Tax=Alteromonas sp. 5E99-2 TaxID=2817683 RepID=UPI001A98C9F9|nr:putative quinol monooxygenase [Alteromonas sp. 5E99-2]MBO1256329.1 antibiotic biosynthesis monooxygenase [Alteromonas sp. 5E99-2]